MTKEIKIQDLLSLPGCRRAADAASWGAFVILLATYWATAPWSVSFWDCPEYVTGAWTLVPGHPPGNPLWVLIERVVTMLSFTGIPPAVLINLSSGLFTAGAGALVVRTLFPVMMLIMGTRGEGGCLKPLFAAGGSLGAALMFGWGDSVWYSAVEAEVYAMSIFFTALTLWLMMKYAFCEDSGKAIRLLVLIAYILGLSIGVHQLNLLVIPALALIFAFRKGVRGWLRISSVLLASFIAVGCILVGMMPSAILLSGDFELFCVNRLGLPYLSGPVVYALLLLVSACIAGIAAARYPSSWAGPLAAVPFFFLSGFFIFKGNYWAGFVISILAAVLILFLARRKGFRQLLSTTILMMAMTLTGFSVYAIVLVRGDIHSPINSALPGNPFSLMSYLGRDQYGSSPLLYGKTPYSKPLMKETFDFAGKPEYKELYLEKGRPVYSPYKQGARIIPKKSLFTSSDSAFNARAMASGSDAYVIDDYVGKPVYTPELDMWFPRITSSDPADIKSFADWAGMTKENMVRVRISEAVDTAGNPVAKKDSSGSSMESFGYRPTYLQSMTMLAGYQTGYMYLRYLMWNFSGRQNDIASTGEVEHGNFITGFTAIDNAMLGAEDALPPDAGHDNPGRNRYYLIPFLLGIAGIIWLWRKEKTEGKDRLAIKGISNRIGRQTLSVITVLFIMTGVAIAVYLNQSPGEPRERDYSFLGSFLAYSLWTGFGILWIAIALWKLMRRMAVRLSRKPLSPRMDVVLACIGFIPGAAAATMMFAVNLDDHDRSGRSVAEDVSANLLNSLEKDAVIFVDGDNYTFPLWYMQEVKGIRRDVRVVNMAYLSMPGYAATQTLPWRMQEGLPMTASYEQLSHRAFLTIPFVENPVADTVPAIEFLRKLYAMSKPEITCRYVSIPTSSGQPLVIDLKAIARRDGYVPLTQRRLVMLDIVATNAASAKPRPVYWHRSLSRRHYRDYLPASTYGLLAWKWDVPDTSSVMDKAALLRKPNGGRDGVYMDETPRSQLNSQRASVIIAARNKFDAGKYADALSLANIADTLFGVFPGGYGYVSEADSAFNVAANLGAILVDAGKATGDSAAAERGRSLIINEQARKERWLRYRRALPPRLRNNMRPK